MTDKGLDRSAAPVADDSDSRNIRSLGMVLMTTLMDQIEGSIELDRDGGTQFTIDFTE